MEFLHLNYFSFNSIIHTYSCFQILSRSYQFNKLEKNNNFIYEKEEIQIDSIISNKSFLSNYPIIKTFKFSLLLGNTKFIEINEDKSYLYDITSIIEIKDFPKKNVFLLKLENYDLFYIYYLFNNIDDFLLFKLKYPEEKWLINHY